MDSKTLRKKFLDFFEKNGHTIIPSAPLVPSEEEQLSGKEKVLFTSAGMQQLIPYLMGKPHPKGNKLADVQKCVRTDDIEEVGDATHHTFFEMLGNWSLGDYWKEGAIDLSFKFLTEELGISIDKLAVSVFAGDEDAPRDEESANKWKALGIPEKRIAYLGKEANWWPTPRKDITTGVLKNAFGPCGPDTEMFIWTGSDPAPEVFDPQDNKWVEVWNDVFMEFNRKEDGTLEELPQKNVDTGMGLERMLAVLNGKDNDYETDLFTPIIRIIERTTTKSYEDTENKMHMRVIADHLRAATFLIAQGVEPSNKLQGYVLRRLLRRVAVKMRLLESVTNQEDIKAIADAVLSMYDGIYFEKNEIHDVISDTIGAELNRFTQTLDRGLHEIEKIEKIDGKKAFDLYQTFGFPYEVTEELFRQKGQEIDKEQFKAEFEKHRELSRTASAGMFKGGLADTSEVVTKYHTATHLLHQALRDVLGPQVFQKGSNITSERLRFDFSFNRKMTNEEIKQVEEIINKRIEEDLVVDHKIVPLDEAKKLNAIGLFDEKYADKVSIYGVGLGYRVDPDALDQRDRGGYYSLEFCGGPHVEHTGMIGGINRGTILRGKIKITKEEAISAGMRRIRAQIG